MAQASLPEQRKDCTMQRRKQRVQQPWFRKASDDAQLHRRGKAALSRYCCLLSTDSRSREIDRQIDQEGEIDIGAVKSFVNPTPTSHSTKLEQTLQHFIFRSTGCSHPPYTAVTPPNKPFQTDIQRFFKSDTLVQAWFTEEPLWQKHPAVIVTV